jgi:phenylalanyl-tRNA synthetase beta chain
MKIAYKWLQELIRIEETPDQLGKLLTNTGLEVEGIEEIETTKGGLKGVVLGTVLTCTPHPEADRLSLTTVSVGTETPLPIVCGAPNVAAGQRVVVATVGTSLYPNGSNEPLVIKKAKIRGAVSEGMICAEDELGLGTNHDGIMVLDTALPDGTPAATYFGISSDYVFEIGLTPNRADAASHWGVARDIKAVTHRPICLPSLTEFKIGDPILAIEVVVENTEAAPRYCGLTISGLQVGESPAWLKERLLAIGVRPINNVVDCTNYVCHELGQPLHAFDAAHITGGQVVVKTVASGSKFVTLDGLERTLTDQDLMICNAEAPMCIAGVFGGQHSGVSEGTTAIFLESAYFSPVWVRRTAQHHGLKTDASFRFERGTDPSLPLYALKRAALLIQQVAGGTIASPITDLYPSPIEKAQVNVSYKNIDRLIGQSLPRTLIHEILTQLDIELTHLSDEGFVASVPTYRVEVQREADIIEEILRIYGFDNVPLSENLSSDYLSAFPTNSPDALRLRVTELLAANGCHEIITNSLTKPRYSEAYQPSADLSDVKILNHLSEELSVMRQSLVFSGLEVITYNVNRRQRDLKLMEFGKSYHLKGERYTEQEHLALFMTGNQAGESWLQPSRPVQFHDLATLVTKILGVMRVGKLETADANPALFEYGIQYMLNKKPLVTAGLLRTSITRAADCRQSVFYAEFDWKYLLKQYSAEVQYKEVARFPEVRRDLSLVLDKSVRFEEIKQLALRTEKQLIQEINVFDVYEGDRLEGKKAYALSFTLQDDQQTLTDKVIDKTMQRLIQAFERELQAVIRK